MIELKTYINLCICLSCFKLLFLKSYISTDFDVHRNWMAITYNLPMNQWYFDTTQEGTLDYPPLFAIFELTLAYIAHFLNLDANGDLLLLTKSQIRSDVAIVYQKITVIVSDCVFYYAVYKLCRSLGPLVSIRAKSKKARSKSDKKDDASSKDNKVASSSTSNSDEEVPKSSDKQPGENLVKSNVSIIKSHGQSLADAIFKPESCTCVALLLLFQPGLLLVDHVHFQYNGFLSGILLLSMASIIQRKYLWGSFWFSVLLNLKHIYLYCAPAYGMYLLTSHCFLKVKDQNRFLSFLTKAGRLGSIVLLVFAVTYAPFFDLEALKQIASRLFPFKRGLTHAYWAPNAWSLYNLADKILATVFKDSMIVKFDLESISRSRKISSTSGLVEEYEHQYLPTVKPLTTFIIVGISTVPIIIKFLLNSGKTAPRLFLKGVTLTAFSSFMFGWHVHEKAIITVLLPLVPISLLEPELRPALLRLTLAGTYSLFPLLFKPAEYLIKVSVLVAYYIYTKSSIKSQDNEKSSSTIYQYLNKAYLLVLILNEFYMTLVFGRFNLEWNPAAKLNKFEFLPLMATSTLSALGVASSYLELYISFLRTPSKN